MDLENLQQPVQKSKSWWPKKKWRVLGFVPVHG